MADQETIKIYHIEGRRSLRVIWICEELYIPYELVFEKGNLMASLEKIIRVNPFVPLAPTVEFRGKVLVESGAIIELLQTYYGNGRLAPNIDSDDYAYYLQWLHFAEGTMMYRQWALRYAAMTAGIPISQMPIGHTADGVNSGLVGIRAVFDFLESYLCNREYFAGSKFSAADIMMHYAIKVAPIVSEFDYRNFEHLQNWLALVESRPAFKRAMESAVPGGYNKYGLPKEQALPFGEPDLSGFAPMPTCLTH